MNVSGTISNTERRMKKVHPIPGWTCWTKWRNSRIFHQFGKLKRFLTGRSSLKNKLWVNLFGFLLFVKKIMKKAQMIIQFVNFSTISKKIYKKIDYLSEYLYINPYSVLWLLFYSSIEAKRCILVNQPVW